MRILIFILIFSLSIGYSQETQNNKVKKKDEKVQAPLSSDEQLQQELDPNVFVYNSDGRRDPFKNLLQGRNSSLSREALEGIAGLTISELVLEGIMRISAGKYKAFLKGPKNHPYDVTVGDKVYDGEIVEINANSVVFKQILTIALGGTKEKKLVKWLNPEEEAGK
jgi:Tfp pilus assembly protein PilP